MDVQSLIYVETNVCDVITLCFLIESNRATGTTKEKSVCSSRTNALHLLIINIAQLSERWW